MCDSSLETSRDITRLCVGASEPPFLLEPEQINGAFRVIRTPDVAVLQDRLRTLTRGSSAALYWQPARGHRTPAASRFSRFSDSLPPQGSLCPDCWKRPKTDHYPPPPPPLLLFHHPLLSRRCGPTCSLCLVNLREPLRVPAKQWNPQTWLKASACCV